MSKKKYNRKPRSNEFYINKNELMYLKTYVSFLIETYMVLTGKTGHGDKVEFYEKLGKIAELTPKHIYGIVTGNIGTTKEKFEKLQVYLEDELEISEPGNGKVLPIFTDLFNPEKCYSPGDKFYIPPFYCHAVTLDKGENENGVSVVIAKLEDNTNRTIMLSKEIPKTED